MTDKIMQFTNLGNSGLKISKVIVGMMSYGTKDWSPWVIDDEEKVFDILKAAYDKGMRTFDTADVYSNGRSEEMLGKFIKKYNIPREKIVILSKCNFPVDTVTPGFSFWTQNNYPAHEYVNLKGLSRKHIFDAVENSVKRLGTYMDVLQIHRFDPTTPMEETMKALNDVVEKGQTRYIGACSMRPTEFAQMQFIAHQNKWAKFISMQNHYNLLHREEERDMNKFCKDNMFGEVGIIPWSPLAKGFLARPLSQISETERAKLDKTIAGDFSLPDVDKEIINRVEKVANDRGVNMAVVATAWIVSKGCSPIIGISSVSRLDDYVDAVHFTLTEEEMKYLEEPYVPKAIYGY